MKVNRYLVSLAGAVVLSAAQGGVAFAQATSIYSGEAVSPTTLKIDTWGSGVALESSDVVYTGSKSVKGTSYGRYQGIRIVLATPVDIKSLMGDTNALFQIVYSLAEKTETTASGSGKFGGKGGAFGGSGSGGRSQGGGSSSQPGGGARGGAAGGLGGSGGGRGTDSKSEIKTVPAENIRIVLGMDDGAKFELNMELSTSRFVRDEWRSLAIPVAAIDGLKNSSGKLKEVNIFTDQPTTLYIGQLQIAQDETPIRVDDLTDQTIAKNDILTLNSSAEGGPSALKYVWTVRGIANADTGANLNPNYLVTLEGKKFKHHFSKGGDFEVTLTVKDVYGIKKSATQKMVVHVTL